jgi:hypothetical protein
MRELGIRCDFLSPDDLANDDHDDDDDDDLYARERRQRRQRRRHNDRLIAQAVRDAATPRPAAGDIIEERLAQLYEGIRSVHEISEDEERLIDDSGGSVHSHTYGELVAVRDVLRLLQPRPVGDTLWDLGSGAGRFVLQAAMEYTGLKTVGVELSEKRHEAAATAARRAALPNVLLVHGDLLQACCEDATLVFVVSLAFGDELMRRLGAKLARLPALRAVALLGRDLPARALDGFEASACSHVAVTWGVARLYVHRRGEML